MNEIERKELQALRRRTWVLDGPDTLSSEEQKRFYELLLNEQETA